ncbi:MAG: hypothetical protein COT26_03265 [Candidatus Kerfeldbacteria bacterium CG08_land_8_20_14_0_20_43_14]|uniref:DUF559 domain-containing protein n=1 Tax=Candidatus Kerfeldbacteria bacterium CG08_land_8_20_14_0_20_43_14 TaxID=2014246 RepID=A0A2H0YPM0_9BACT|nr:MAG: hypothetical protein COT26_03265 [Candidatus Kerfeldbacteria bacterium CG08_land_8_20_14_0_20_43_14]
MIKIFNNKIAKSKRQSLRNNMPKAEIILWSYLKNRQLEGFKFRRQQCIGPYIVDFYCPTVKLAIEIDGESHFSNTAMLYDLKREKFIKQYKINVLRVLNTDVYNNINGVLQIILDALNQISSHTTPGPSSDRRG